MELRRPDRLSREITPELTLSLACLPCIVQRMNTHQHRVPNKRKLRKSRTREECRAFQMERMIQRGVKAIARDEQLVELGLLPSNGLTK